MYDKSQLMRGTLEGCILKILSQNTSYGYEIVTTLLGYGFKDIKEEPFIHYWFCLEKKGIITSEMLPLSTGSKQKILFHYTRWSRLFERI